MPEVSHEEYLEIVEQRHQKATEDLRKQNRQMKKALEFYADKDSYKDTRTWTNRGYWADQDVTENCTPKVLEDKGKIAREALK